MFFTTRRSGGFEPETPPDGRGHSFRQNHEGRNVPEKRDFRGASGGDEAGRAMAETAEPHRANPSLSAIIVESISGPERGRKEKRRNEEK